MVAKPTRIMPTLRGGNHHGPRRPWRKKRALTGSFAYLAGPFIAIALISMETAWSSTQHLEVNPVTAFRVDKGEVTKHLVTALRFKTVSFQDPAKFDASAFLGLHEYLRQTFPRVHSSLIREVIGQYSLLYTWQGQDPTLQPIVLMAHMDVVPAEEEGEEKWTQPPFEGAVAEGYIWGRGALDDKGSMMGIFEAVETLLGHEFRPRRTVYLAFGHDEEVLGSNGGEQIAALLHSRGIVPEFVLDEGGSVVRRAAKEIHSPIAVVGVAEKGYLNLKLTVEGRGGHSALPPKQTTIGILSRAIDNLEKHQMPARVTKPVRQSLKALQPELPFFEKAVLANLWLFGPRIVSKGGSPEINAEVRTTTAPTIFNAGIRENVLPRSATAIVNFRTLPGDDVERVRSHAIKVIHDPRVTVTLSGHHHDPSGMSSPSSPSYKLIVGAVLQMFPGAVPVPALVAAATDSRHYSGIATGVYRFIPAELDRQDLARIHGKDERISPDNYVRGIQFYILLITNAAQ
jgi:carboxypeptidase PM20D1